ncbi:hypothetical protein A4X13_0g7936 [Tilletia indica]|uniref:Uncharacterized protein n=1 Tax=Tilletia indica TaxID=43049 RepID=A0A177TVI0_9BASI|nr:hypothetical protein A4X13_0g7936 [Tilletia indica]
MANSASSRKKGAKANPPRCQKGCMDPEDASQKALKAQCSCSRSKGKSIILAPVNTDSPAPVSSSPSPAPVGSAAAYEETQRLLAEVDRFVAEAEQNDGEGSSTSNTTSGARSLPSFALRALQTEAQTGSEVVDPEVVDREEAGSQAEKEVNDDMDVDQEPTGQDDDESDADGNGIINTVTQTKVKPLKDSEHQDIWYNLGNAHTYASSNYKLEPIHEKRNKLITRGLWRIIRSASELATRTGSAIFVGWATIEPGKHKTKEVVFASENICDPARPILYGMTQEMHDKFKTSTRTYREAQIAQAAKHAAAEAAWQAEKIALYARIAELEAQTQQQPPALLSSTTTSLDASSSNSMTGTPALTPPANSLSSSVSDPQPNISSSSNSEVP